MPEALESVPPPRSWREAWREPEFRALSVAAFVAFFARLWEGTLDGDPVVYASVAKGIAQSGNWIDLSIGSQPYWNKPPLMFWLTAGLFQLFGTSTFAACFWPALFGAASCLALHRFAREAFDRPAALYAALALLLTPELLRYGSRLRLESIVVFFTLLTVHDAWRAVQTRDPVPLRRVGLWIGCLLLAKGGPGLIALAVVAAFLGATRAGGLLHSRAALQGLVVLLLLGLSWPAIQWLRNGDAWIAQVIGVELLQVDELGIGPQNPLTFYSWRMVRVNSVWLVLGLLGVRALWRERERYPTTFRLVVSWTLVSVVMISLPERIYTRYLNALHPILALLSGFWLARRLDSARFEQLSAWLPRLTAAAAVVLLVVPMPFHNDEARAARTLDAALRMLTPEAAAVPVYRGVHPFARADFHFHLDRDVREIEALDRAEALPLVVVPDGEKRPLEEAGWRHLVSGWHWHALIAPTAETQASDSERSPDSRRLQ